MKCSVTRSVTRSVIRSVALGLCAAALLPLASCSQQGSYRLSWMFEDKTTLATESTATGCGRHYVDSISVTGTDQTGDAQQLAALCTSGWVTADAPPGTWSFSVQMLDSQGAVIPSDPPDGVTMTISNESIAADSPPAQLSVGLWPL